MSVKPATDENRAAWTGTAAGWLQAPIPRNEDVAAGDVMYLVGAVVCLDARIEQDAETIRALTTRAEEAEALLRSSMPTLENRMRGLKEDGHGDNFEEWARLRSLLGLIEAHLQEHAE